VKVLNSAVFCLLLISTAAGCTSLQSARIRQDVTIDTHVASTTSLPSMATLMVLTLPLEDLSLSKTTLTVNEAAADIVSLELLNGGFNVIDRAVVNDYMRLQGIGLRSGELSKILGMGESLEAHYLILTNLFENLQASHKIDFLPWNILTSLDTSANIGISARMIDLKRGEVVWVGIATTQDQNFQTAIQRIARELISSLQGGGDQ